MGPQAAEPRRTHADALEAIEGGQFLVTPADVPHLLLEDDLAEPGLIAPVGFVPSGPMPSAVVVCFFA